ncbi:MAG: PKD domain-containing protein [Thermoplasmatales archaeon]|nr:PKD domain-containing protein [Thermoplasmatales archaeon]
MKKKIVGIFVMTLLISTTVLPVAGTINVSKTDSISLDTGGDYFLAATDADIQKAIADGVAWLASQQDLTGTPDTNPNYGSWGAYSSEWDDATAITALVLIKLQDYAYELGYDSPWDPDYIYNNAITDGWWYLFSIMIPETPPADNGIYVRKQPIGIQLHTIVNPPNVLGENPDTNGNGIGIYLGRGDETPGKPYRGRLYHTGIFLSALVATGMPDAGSGILIDFDGDGNIETFGEIAQDVVDWIAFAQTDNGYGRGGFNYGPWDNNGSRSDNSISGYVYQGLAAAEANTARPGATAFACTVPYWIKRELNYWIDYIQYDDTPFQGADGGSGYTHPYSEINQLKTGNLIFEMRFYGDNPDTSTRFDRALNFIERFWRAANTNPGWGFNKDPAEYQAMFCLMKGLEYSGIDLIDTEFDGTGKRDDSWYNQEPPATPAQDFASVLVAQQSADDSWPCTSSHSDNQSILSTTWALLTLEKVVPLCGNLSISKEAPLTSHQGDTITYTINYANPTNETVHNAYIIDYIPSGTTYKLGSASPPGVYDSGPPPYIRWDFPFLLPGASGSVTFEVTVDYGDPIDSIRNNVYIYSDETNPSMASAETYLIYPDEPPDGPDIEGPTDGIAGVEYNYTIVSTDPDGDRIFYFYDWDDGTPIACIGPCESGEEALVNHTWEKQGTYTIKVMAVNENNAKSDWSELTVTMPRTRAINTPFLNFLQNHPNLFPILQRLLQRLGLQ